MLKIVANEDSGHLSLVVYSQYTCLLVVQFLLYLLVSGVSVLNLLDCNPLSHTQLRNSLLIIR